MAPERNDIDQDDALQALEDRLEVAKAKHAEPDDASAASKAAGMKHVTEFSGAVIVGIALGIGADKFFGSTPWGLLVGLILGFAAGMMNVLMAGREALDTQYLGEDLPPEEEDEDDY